MQLIVLTIFYIFHKSGTKTILNWSINKYLRAPLTRLFFLKKKLAYIFKTRDKAT